ncbi:hypothetical protein NSK_007447 [Nannochloropsis salina CCMP1776]|uniref:Uncharacterized protein n=1 Tax=Nannochloropsis salina CCMP1776 TaxID=1027361 RepID=A0A4D9CQ37_9STRA|nr:hypothetical protein NSK_007447 [Nannochloropsis salina CCMP1776]|eukprot:TFJ81230.1 hypothetical protein NSK_007447 [Nannochloropsis salina CCMP1776]
MTRRVVEQKYSSCTRNVAKTICVFRRQAQFGVLCKQKGQKDDEAMRTHHGLFLCVQQDAFHFMGLGC